jgi:hypothetical protein
MSFRRGYFTRNEKECQVYLNRSRFFARTSSGALPSARSASKTRISAANTEGRGDCIMIKQEGAGFVMIWPFVSQEDLTCGY